MSVSKELVQLIKESGKKDTKAYDTPATVTRVEGQTVWVHIPGGVDETPVRRTIEAKPGDEVQIRVSGGSAWVVGNTTAPPTDDTTAIISRLIAVEAETKANTAKIVSEQAAEQAADALGMAADSLATDTLHYLATSASTGVTVNTPGWTTTIQTIDPTNKYLWTYHTYTKADGTQSDTTPVIIGTYGVDGTSVTILGSYNSLAELQTAHPTGNLGDAYMVAGDLYVWNGSSWENVGQIQGPQGAPGQSVTVSSVAYAYQLSASGTTVPTGTWEATPQAPTTTQYAWTRTTTTFSDGSTAVTYTVGGKTGTNGTNGTNGTSPTVTSSVTQYQKSASGTSVPSGAWSNTALAPDKDNYVWTKTTITYSDGSTAVSYAVAGKTGPTGAQGVSITAVQPQYYLSTSSSTPTGGSWGTSLTYESGKYIWTRERISYSDSTTGYSTQLYNAALTSACANALTALNTANAVNQYNWHTETGNDPGTHITPVPKTDFETDPTGIINAIITNIGMKIRSGLETLASYGAKTIIGDLYKAYVEITSTKISMIAEDGTPAIEITSAGSSQTIEDQVTLNITINDGDSDSVNLNLEGAGIGSHIEIYVEDTFSQQYQDTIEVILGTSSTGSGTNINFTYSYDANTNDVTFENSNGDAIKLLYINYFKKLVTPETNVYGEFYAWGRKGNQNNCVLIDSGSINITGSINGLSFNNPALLNSMLSPISSRCAITSGGIIKAGKWVFVQLELTIKTTLSANNTWGLVSGFSTVGLPVTGSHTALAASVQKNYGNVSANIADSGNLVVQTSGATLVNNDVLLVSGWYITA